MNAQVAKMQAGREAQIQRDREAAIESVAALRRWVRAESLVFRTRARMADVFGRDSDQFADANASWHRILALKPNTPPDDNAAWKAA